MAVMPIGWLLQCEVHFLIRRGPMVSEPRSRSSLEEMKELWDERDIARVDW